MSENKGKAKAKPTAKSAGKNKAAVMNSRSPKKPTAISGDTMSNYAMYKKGGLVKKQGGGSKNGKVTEYWPNATESDKKKFDKYVADEYKKTQKLIKKGKLSPTPYKKGGLVKAQAGIWKKEKSINEDGSSMTRRTSDNPITGNRRVVTKIKSADGDKSRSVKISSRQKGGKVRRYQDGGPKDGGSAISDPKLKQRSREFIGRPEKLDPRMDPMMKPYKSIQSRPIPPQIKEGITPESSKTSKYTTNDSPTIQYRKQKGGKISPSIGTGSKANMVKNLYKKYTKK